MGLLSSQILTNLWQEKKLPLVAALQKENCFPLNKRKSEKQQTKNRFDNNLLVVIIQVYCLGKCSGSSDGVGIAILLWIIFFS